MSSTAVVGKLVVRRTIAARRLVDLRVGPVRAARLAGAFRRTAGATLGARVRRALHLLARHQRRCGRGAMRMAARRLRERVELHERIGGIRRRPCGEPRREDRDDRRARAYQW